jgi:hypothetical protein
MAVRMNRLVQPSECFPFKISTPHREVGRPLSREVRRLAAGTAATVHSRGWRQCERERREKEEAVDLDLLW